MRDQKRRVSEQDETGIEATGQGSKQLKYDKMKHGLGEPKNERSNVYSR